MSDVICSLRFFAVISADSVLRDEDGAGMTSPGRSGGGCCCSCFCFLRSFRCFLCLFLLRVVCDWGVPFSSSSDSLSEPEGVGGNGACCDAVPSETETEEEEEEVGGE